MCCLPLWNLFKSFYSDNYIQYNNNKTINDPYDMSQYYQHDENIYV